MIIFNLALGLFMIACGFAVRKYPNLIAGYNTMSEEQKKAVDIDGLSTLMKKGFVAIGILVAFVPNFFVLINLPKTAIISSIVIILTGTIIVLILGRKYSQINK